VPTGVAIRDPREQLFAAAERILLRDGPAMLTSRAVTAEAGVAKGVLHRHFADFDAFLAELVLDRIARLGTQANALRASAGTGTVTGNLTAALTELFGPVAIAIVGLITFRDDLRVRLRDARTVRDARAGRDARAVRGVPLLGEATAMIAAYLAVEQDLGRVVADADVPTLALMLIGSGHLLFAGRDDVPPEAAEVRAVVAAVLAGAGLPASWSSELPVPGMQRYLFLECSVTCSWNAACRGRSLPSAPRRTHAPAAAWSASGAAPPAGVPWPPARWCPSCPRCRAD
jgi:AcrR family transcriptional regulator